MRFLIPADARISLLCAMRLLITTGRNTRLVDGSAQVTSATEAVPEITSIRPTLASRASHRESSGWRKSPSTKITFEPALAISCANETAIVDLPSLGSDDVTPMTLFDLLTLTKSPAILMARIDSVNRENGESTTCHSKLS